MLKFKTVIGSKSYGWHSGYMRALRILLEQGNRLAEVGTAYIERSDGVVVVRVDLDANIPANR